MQMDKQRHSKLRMVFIIPTLDKGGAERVLVNFVNQLDLSKYEPVIFCLKKTGGLVEKVKPEIAVIDIKKPRVYFSVFKINKELKKINPDVVIGWLGNVNAVLAFYKWRLPNNIAIMCRESSIPSLFNSHYSLPFLFNYMYKFYNRFDGIISQSVAMKEDLVNNFKVKNEKIKVIHNPVVIQVDNTSMSAQATAFIDGNSKFLLFVGRFSKEKQIEILLDTLLLLSEKHRLILVGYGPLEEMVKQKIVDNNLNGRVLIVSNCSNPGPYYKRADCILLCSAFEGFPNVILEANAYGCPAVVYKTQGGAKEIINEYNGVYIEPESDGGIQLFADTIRLVCGDTQKFDKAKIASLTLEKYGADKIANCYLDYITEVIVKKKSTNN